MKPQFYLAILCLFLIFNCSSDELTEEQEHTNEALYFPALNSDAWETKSISELNWNETKLQPLLNYLEEKNTKSFMILHNGKIVVE